MSWRWRLFLILCVLIPALFGAEIYAGYRMYVSSVIGITSKSVQRVEELNILQRELDEYYHDVGVRELDRYLHQWVTNSITNSLEQYLLGIAKAWSDYSAHRPVSTILISPEVRDVWEKMWPSYTNTKNQTLVLSRESIDITDILYLTSGDDVKRLRVYLKAERGYPVILERLLLQVITQRDVYTYGTEMPGEELMPYDLVTIKDADESVGEGILNGDDLIALEISVPALRVGDSFSIRVIGGIGGYPAYISSEIESASPTFRKAKQIWDFPYGLDVMEATIVENRAKLVCHIRQEGLPINIDTTVIVMQLGRDDPVILKNSTVKALRDRDGSLGENVMNDDDIAALTLEMPKKTSEAAISIFPVLSQPTFINITSSGFSQEELCRLYVQKAVAHWSNDQMDLIGLEVAQVMPDQSTDLSRASVILSDGRGFEYERTVFKEESMFYSDVMSCAPESGFLVVALKDDDDSLPILNDDDRAMLVINTTIGERVKGEIRIENGPPAPIGLVRAIDSVAEFTDCRINGKLKVRAVGYYPDAELYRLGFWVSASEPIDLRGMEIYLNNSTMKFDPELYDRYEVKSLSETWISNAWGLPVKYDSAPQYMEKPDRFGVWVVKDDDGSITPEKPVLNSGDIAIITICAPALDDLRAEFRCESPTIVESPLSSYVSELAVSVGSSIRVLKTVQTGSGQMLYAERQFGSRQIDLSKTTLNSRPLEYIPLRDGDESLGSGIMNESDLVMLCTDQKGECVITTIDERPPVFTPEDYLGSLINADL